MITYLSNVFLLSKAFTYFSDMFLISAIDYVFAHFCGILLSSTVYFLLYVIYRRNRPNIYPRAILPAFVSGTMYAVATSLWFVANRSLSEPVSFPIISTVPPGISLVVGILVYKEIRVCTRR